MFREDRRRHWEAEITYFPQSPQPIDSRSFSLKRRYLDIFEIFILKMGQISSNLFKKGVCKMIVCRHFCSGMRGNQNFEILNEKVTYVFRLFVFLNFFCAFPFLLLSAVDQLGLLPVQKSVIAMGKSYYGVAICSRRQFFSEVFSQISEHFRTCFRLH